RPKGWLAPSLQHRVDTVLTWVNKLIKLAPITGISQELVRFDKKGTKDVNVFLAKKPEVLKRILSQAKRPLRDA
ncbi:MULTISPECIES: RRXRR domain-containing protein, partial [Spirulina sp. CCY15215]|uniref:RRXRR domain-containing protein n=1 Tax=Spirulina sp. CCY15215 TaxID=2767591 RepID=UPI0019525D51